MKDMSRFLLITLIFATILSGVLLYHNVNAKAEEPLTKLWKPVKGVYSFGIKDPSGRMAVMTSSSYNSKKVKNVLAPYPTKTIGGIKFYEVSSWEDTSKVAMISYEDRDRMIWRLFNEITKLKSRVAELEKKLLEFESKTKK